MKRLTAALMAILMIMLACKPADVPSAASGTPLATNTPTPALTDTPAPTEPPIAVVLYVPSADRTALVPQEAQTAQDRPRALLQALVAAGALPNVDYGVNIGFSCGTDTVRMRGDKVTLTAVRLDVADAFAVAVRAMRPMEARLTLQSLADTFLHHYQAEAFKLTVEGTDLETMYEAYGDAIVWDQWFPAAEN